MLDRKLLRDMWRLKGQVLAIAFVVACGIATYVMSKTAMDSLRQARDTYYQEYRLADVFAVVKRAPMVLKEQLQKIDGVITVYPRIVYSVTLDVAGMDEPASGLLISLPEVGGPLLNDVFLRQGRFPEPYETDAILASEAFTEAHGLMTGDTVDAIINGRKRTLRITGVGLSPEFVYSIGPGTILPDDKRFGIFWMGRRALEAASDLDGAFNSLVLKTASNASIEDITGAVDRLLGPYGGVDSIGVEDQLSYWFVENELQELEAMIVIVPGIFLGVSAFLLNIVLSRRIATERELIGMLKALGLSNGEVGWHYMKLALTVVILGAIIGTGLGYWLGQGVTELYTQFFRFPLLAFVFRPQTVVVGFAISMAAAVLGAAYAVAGVVKLPPAEAMHPAPPTSYRGTLSGRLGLPRLFSVPSRMIVRHLERRPLRALMSITGVALSAAIFVAASFGIDAFDHMIDVQYNLADREDVNVVFAEIKPHRVLDELLALPGVLAAEPYRVVPVRLVNGHRLHRTVIRGMKKDGDIRQVVDRDLEPITVQADGLMLSAKLAEILDLEVGDKIGVEVLAGRRPRLQIVVSAVVQEYVGAQAYMALESLNRLMGDAPVASGAALLTDGESNSALFARVKDIPHISSTLLKEAAIQSVMETMAETILKMTFFNTFFAGMIAFGVVYNIARISLSERAHELASMRVLGYRRREVAFILLGELALLVAIAVPLGLLIGRLFAVGIAAGLDTELFRIPVEISPRTYAFAALVVIAASLLSGFTVWRRLQRLDIVSVLKTRE